MNLSKYTMNICQRFHVTHCLVREPKIVASLEEIPMMWLTVINIYKHANLSGMLECVCFTDTKLAFSHNERKNQLSYHFTEFINEQELLTLLWGFSTSQRCKTALARDNERQRKALPSLWPEREVLSEAEQEEDPRKPREQLWLGQVSWRLTRKRAKTKPKKGARSK